MGGNKMKLFQVALDLFSTDEALNVLKEISEFVDIIELGTPLMVAEGAHVVRKVKELYPEKTVFADIKVMDGGSIVPKVVFDAGADMVSVLAAADNSTIEATIELAGKYERKVLVDMCSVKDIFARAKEVEALGPDFICVHVGYDVQNKGVDPVQELRKLDGIKIPKAIAGGIKLSNFEAAVQSPADVIIVGGGIYNQPNMREVAEKMREIIDRYK